MKTMFFLQLFLLFFSPLFAQENFISSHYYLTGHFYDEDNMDFYSDAFYFSYAPKMKRKASGVSEITITNTNKKGKKRIIIQQFNKNGMLVYVKNKSIGYQFNASYQDDSLIVYSSKKYPKKHFESKYTYEKGKIKNKMELKNGKLIRETLNQYTSAGKILSSETHSKGKIRKLIYEYNEEGKLKKTSFTIDGKVKKIWNHECREKGEAIASIKEEIVSSKCEYREESADGSYTVFVRTIQNGKTYLRESKYTKDSVLFEVNRYKNDTILFEKRTITKGYEVETEYKRGKPTFQTHYKFQNGEISAYWYTKKGKFKYGYENSYDEKGKKIGRKSFGKKGKDFPTSESVYTFDENGLVLSDKRFSKGKLRYSTEYSYKFF